MLLGKKQLPILDLVVELFTVMFAPRKIFSVLAAALGAAAFPVEAALIYGNLGSSGTDALDSDNSTVTGTTWYAQGFHTPTSVGLLYLQSMELGLSVTSGSSGVRVQLFANATNQPTGAALASMTNTVNSVTPTLYNFTLSTPYHLANNTTYWVVASDPDGGNSVLWNWDLANTHSTAQNGSGYSASSPDVLRSINSGTNWADRSSLSFVSMNLYATGPAAVPEPGTWAAAVLLVGTAGLIRWRKREQGS